MRTLYTINPLDHRAGTELYVRDVAVAVRALSVPLGDAAMSPRLRESPGRGIG
jgi:hypothetical protein